MFKTTPLPIIGEGNQVLLNGKIVDNLPNVFVSIEGSNNLVSLTTSENTNLNNIQIFIKGNGNKIVLERPEKIANVIFRIWGNKNMCEFDKIRKCENSQFLMTDMGLKKEFFNKRKLIIQDGFWCCGMHCFCFGHNKVIQIGKNCMFSHGIYLWNTDAHYIYDKNTHERLNKEADIYIGDHVWIGRDVSIHKGAKVPNGCIVGANSFVSKSFSETNCIIAGIPAKIIRKNVEWEQ